VVGAEAILRRVRGKQSSATATAAQPATKPKSNRRKLFDLHAWLGFHLALLMTIVLATGTIATVANEIDWLIQDDMRVTPDGGMVSWGEMEAAVNAFRPDGQIVTFGPMAGDHFAWRARVAYPSGGYEFVHVDQWTGEVTGTTHALTVQRFFRDLHRYLFMPNFIGLPLVTSLAFVLAISLYTGLKTARNWKTLMFRLRLNKGSRIAVGDAHKAAGIWASWFFLVMIVTGVWYLFEFGTYVTTGEALEPDRPSVTAERAAEFGTVIDDRPLGEVIAAAQSAFPNLKITEVQYPRSATSAFIVLGTRINPALRQRANRVFLDPESLEVIKVQRAEDIGSLAYLNEMADPLHFGSFGGLPTKAIWFVFGLAMTGLSITGVWLTWQRMKAKAPSTAQLATLPVLIISLAFATQWWQRYGVPSPATSTTIFAATALEGGINAELLAPGPDGPPRLRLSSVKGRPNFESAELITSNGSTTITPLRATGRTIDVALDLGEADRLLQSNAAQLRLRSPDHVISASFDLTSARAAEGRL
jgi:uncharacterized iron-regulated membrane protein